VSHFIPAGHIDFLLPPFGLISQHCVIPIAQYHMQHTDMFDLHHPPYLGLPFPVVLERGTYAEGTGSCEAYSGLCEFLSILFVSIFTTLYRLLHLWLTKTDLISPHHSNFILSFPN
jgi:hypothetical protein